MPNKTPTPSTPTDANSDSNSTTNTNSDPNTTANDNSDSNAIANANMDSNSSTDTSSDSSLSSSNNETETSNSDPNAQKDNSVVIDIEELPSYEVGITLPDASDEDQQQYEIITEDWMQPPPDENSLPIDPPVNPSTRVLDLSFGSHSVYMVCPHCQKNIWTKVKKSSGYINWLICILAILLVVIMPIAILLLCLLCRTKKTYRHTCPYCHRQIYDGPRMLNAV